MFKENRLIFNSSNRLKSLDESDFLNDVLDSDTPLTAKEIDDLNALRDSSKISLDIKKEINLAFQENIIDTHTHENLLIEIENESDPAALERVRQNISERRENVQALIREFELHSSIKINHKKFSLLREDKDIEQQKADFIKLSPKEQKEVLQEVKNYLEVATKQFQELSRLVSDDNLDSEADNFKKLTTSERSAYIDESKKVQDNYLKLLQSANVNQAKIKEKMELLHIHGLAGKKLLLQNLQESLAYSALDREFEEADPSRREKYPDFKILTPAEKNEVLIKLREEIKSEYIYKLRNHKYFFAATYQDAERFESFFDGKFQIKSGELSIQYLDSIMESLFKIKIEEQKFSPEILNHFNWDQLPDYERQALLDNDVLTKYAENKENIELDNAYKKRLEAYLNMKPLGIINKKGVESYYKWFQQNTLERKSDIIHFAHKVPGLDFIESTKQKRLEDNKLFLSLPKHIQAKHKASYLEKSYDDRKILLQSLIEEAEKETELCEKFDEKLDEKIEKKLLTPKSRSRYVNMFKSMNNEEKEHYLENCNLDDPKRINNLNEFRALLQFIPENKLKKIEGDFYNLDYNRRVTKLAKLKEQYLDQKDEVAKAKLETEKTKIESEEVNEKPQISAVDLFVSSAEKYERENDKSAALKFYKEALLVDKNIKPQLKQKIEKKIAALEEDQEYYDRLKEGHINEIIHTEVEKLINENPSLLVSKEIIAMLEAAYELEKKNEELIAREQAQIFINQKLSDLSSLAANNNQEDLTEYAEKEASNLDQEIKQAELSESEQDQDQDQELDQEQNEEIQTPVDNETNVQIHSTSELTQKDEVIQNSAIQEESLAENQINLEDQNVVTNIVNAKSESTNENSENNKESDRTIQPNSSIHSESIQATADPISNEVQNNPALNVLSSAETLETSDLEDTSKSSPELNNQNQLQPESTIQDPINQIETTVTEVNNVFNPEDLIQKQETNLESDSINPDDPVTIESVLSSNLEAEGTFQLKDTTIETNDQLVDELNQPSSITDFAEENTEVVQAVEHEDQEIELDVNEYSKNPNELISFFSQIQNQHPEARTANRFKLSSEGNKLSSETFKREVLDPKKLDFIQNKVAPLLYQKLKIENNPAMQATILKYISNYKFVNNIDAFPVQDEAA